MCTLVVAANVVPEYPLLVVANRDEDKLRASSPPLRWEGTGDGGAGFLAPRDEVAGGTWLGLNDHGVFVAITNRFLGPRDPSRISRGLVVIDALRRGASARAIHRDLMTAIDPTKYNGFHLVYADAKDVLATIADGEGSVAHLTLGDGLSVVTERSFAAGNVDDRPRLEKIRAAFERLAEGPMEGLPQRMTKLLSEHDAEDPLGATCIHLDALKYGTRSSMVLTRERQSGHFNMLWAEGPPCVTPFLPVATR